MNEKFHKLHKEEDTIRAWDSPDPKLIVYLKRQAQKVLGLPRAFLRQMHQLGDGPITSYYSGKPEGISLIDHKGEMLFRHYIRNEEIVDAILESRVLQAGKTPYADAARSSRMYWSDLTGVFLTTVDADPVAIGVGDSRHYIDICLHPEIPVLRISEDIFLIAAKPGKQVPIIIMGVTGGFLE